MHYKKPLTIAILTVSVVALSAFMPKQEIKKQQDVKFKNLKVLPKSTTKDQLDKVMDGFKVGLGVRCNFCHVPMKDNPKKMDFASDEKPEKETARDMMKMTAKINKKYFHDMKTKEGAIIAISCITCHNGKSEPALAKI
ncbi:MAG: c-type cytochrome [Bacteroidota bacterium]